MPLGIGKVNNSIKQSPTPSLFMNPYRYILRELKKRKRLAHGWTNETSLRDGLVIKKYIGMLGVRSYHAEKTALLKLAQALPVVPELVHSDQDKLELHIKWIDGIHIMGMTQEADILRGHEACGALLRKLQSIPTATMEGKVSGSGAVIVHGDYCIKNFMFSNDCPEVVGFLDWEHTHLGDALEDIAWYEWSLRSDYSCQVSYLAAFYRGYGRTPTWSERHKAILKKLQSNIDTAEASNDTKTAEYWSGKMAIAQRLEELL